MIEVFKTNVKTPDHASMLVDQILTVFNYTANFDLQDCDRILRIQSGNSPVKAHKLIKFIRDLGFHAEVLQDYLPAENERMIKHYI